MKTTIHILAASLGMLGSFLVPTPAQAGFIGGYALTPPAPGVYFSPGQYGRWEASVLSGGIDTTGAPDRLVLTVPTGSIYANALRFQTQAVADGEVSFDASAVSVGPGFIRWFSQSGSAKPVFANLDEIAGGQPSHFSFQVKTGDTFGFELMSGSDAIPPGAPLDHKLTVEHFAAPVPEPGLLALALAGALVIACGRRRP